jgi:DNA repair protein RadA/Sms
VLGEIALSGDVRPAAHAEARLKEAAKLGFARAFVPAGTKADSAALALEPVKNVADLVRLVGGAEA